MYTSKFITKFAVRYNAPLISVKQSNVEKVIKTLICFTCSLPHFEGKSGCICPCCNSAYSRY